MRCYKCGNEMTTTADDYINGICSGCKSQKDNKGTFGMYGWICPRCGVVHSPFDSVCHCPPPMRTSTTIDTSEC